MSIVQPATYYDNIYRQAMSDLSFEWMKERDDMVAQYLEGTILDLGCGLGYIANRTKEEYVGFDFSTEAIDRANEMCENLRAQFKLGYIEHLPHDLGRFDTVLLLEVLEHVADPPFIFKVAMQHARKRVIVTVPRNMPGRAHVWPIWTRANLEQVMGELSVCKLFGGPDNDRWWIAVRDFE